MIDIIVYVAAALSLFNAIILVILVRKREKGDLSDIQAYMKYGAEAQMKMIEKSSAFQRERLEDLERRIEENTKTNELRLLQMRDALDSGIKYMNTENRKELEQMRLIVDEKLSDTLSKRLDKSFELISGRLEAVYKGIGEVHSLAGSVSDIKKIFSNVKSRGSWGEVQLLNMLEEIMSPEQFERNVRIDPLSDERVDFVLKIPTKDDSCILLPIDSKFPVEEYYRLCDAAESGDRAAFDAAVKGFDRRIKEEAEKIAAKYISPPKTTDFAVMYLPSEGLYAEVAKRNDLGEFLRSKKIMAAGPNNLGALLTSLQAGFKSVSIEKRSAELWELLAAFKTEFFRFAELLSKTGKKLKEAQDNIENAARKTRSIQKKLSLVEGASDEQLSIMPDEEFVFEEREG